MTPTQPTSARRQHPAPTGPAGPRRTRPKRGEGQWALGYREPLNANEQSKKDDDPLNVRARIENIYAKRGFDSIDPGDLRGRFRWWGLYTQRKPGIDGGKTGALGARGAGRRVLHAPGPHRRRPAQRRAAARDRRRSPPTSRATPPTSPTGRTSSTTGSASRTCPTIWQRLEAVGLETQEACGDSPRVILGSPVAGVAADEIIDGTAGDRGDQAPLHRQPRVLQPAAQVQDRDHRPPQPGRGPRDQRRRVRRRRPPRARPRLRRLGRRRAVHQPDARPAARRLGPARRGARTSGRASSRSSATTATGGCARAPG